MSPIAKQQAFAAQWMSLSAAERRSALAQCSVETLDAMLAASRDLEVRVRQAKILRKPLPNDVKELMPAARDIAEYASAELGRRHFGCAEEDPS